MAKNILITGALMLALALPNATYAQTQADQYKSLLEQLVALLTEQLASLQSQLAALQSDDANTDITVGAASIASEQDVEVATNEYSVNVSVETGLKNGYRHEDIYCETYCNGDEHTHANDAGYVYLTINGDYDHGSVIVVGSDGHERPWSLDRENLVGDIRPISWFTPGSYTYTIKFYETKSSTKPYVVEGSFTI